MGLAAALLVFTGIWHLTEFLMDRGSKDARRLIPFGAVYLLLGVLIALGLGGAIVGGLAVVAAAGGLIVALRRRKSVDIRSWVVWAFIVLDALIVLVLVRHWM